MDDELISRLTNITNKIKIEGNMYSKYEFVELIGSIEVLIGETMLSTFVILIESICVCISPKLVEMLLIFSSSESKFDDIVVK